jgi:hypothetical protein
MGNKLHELLAVEADRKQKGKVILTETINTFTKKGEHFDGLIKIYKPNTESFEDKIPDQVKKVVTTVDKKLDYAQGAIITAIDAQISKEETNSSGTVKAELLIGDKTFELSATSLLALEGQLVNIRALYKTIPTLDPTREWNEDVSQGDGTFRTDKEELYRTKKIQKPLELSPATKEHPAQVQLVSEDVQVGRYETTYLSGKISVASKSERLSKIDKLIDAVKRARAKANQAEVVNKKIGKEIFNFINK